jgi:GDPmannose 4,6-dehydratase
MLQQSEPDDFVLATGRMASVREFCDLAASALDFELAWEGEGANTVGIEQRSGKTIIRTHPRHYRPAEVDQLIGNARKANEKLGWSPTTALPELVSMMVEADLKRARRGQWLA